jgi:hypothetical protein
MTTPYEHPLVVLVPPPRPDPRPRALVVVLLLLPLHLAIGALVYLVLIPGLLLVLVG